MSQIGHIADGIGAMLLAIGTTAGVVGLNALEQGLRIILLVVSIISFALAAILHKKKLKEELKKKCPPGEKEDSE